VRFEAVGILHARENRFQTLHAFRLPGIARVAQFVRETAELWWLLLLALHQHIGNVEGPADRHNDGEDKPEQDLDEETSHSTPFVARLATRPIRRPRLLCLSYGYAFSAHSYGYAFFACHTATPSSGECTN
jgi:hypothetical protein